MGKPALALIPPKNWHSPKFISWLLRAKNCASFVWLAICHLRGTALSFKNGYNCPLLWSATKINPPSHVIASPVTSPLCYPLYSIASITSIHSIASIATIGAVYFGVADFFFGWRGMWVGCEADLTSPPSDFLFSSIHHKPTNPPSHQKEGTFPIGIALCEHHH